MGSFKEKIKKQAKTKEAIIDEYNSVLSNARWNKRYTTVELQKHSIKKEKLVSVDVVLKALEDFIVLSKTEYDEESLKKVIMLWGDKLKILKDGERKQKLLALRKELEDSLEKAPEKCKICGAAMTIAKTEYGKVKYVCSKATVIGQEIGSEMWNHYGNSEVYVFTDLAKVGKIQLIDDILKEMGDEEQ